MLFKMLDEAKQQILIVDDQTVNQLTEQAYLEEEGYNCLIASNGQMALDIVQQEDVDLILLDVVMPEMNGYQVATTLKENSATSDIPIIMVTSLDDSESLLKGLSCGVEEYITKPVNRVELQIRVKNLLRLKKAADVLREYNTVMEQEVQQRTVMLEVSFLDTIDKLGKAADFRDDDTGAHVRRIGLYASLLAETMGMDAAYCRTITHASPLHDIGKIGIPDHILFKKGELDADEWAIMRSHPIIGASILENSDSPYIAMGEEIARCHHERWDGSGYPHGLKGDEIPLSARIMTICDIYDALRSNRPYKEAFSHEKAMEVIVEGDGRTMPGHFDPNVLLAFKNSASAMREIFETSTCHDRKTSH